MAIPFGTPPAFMGYVGFVKLKAGEIQADPGSTPTGALNYQDYTFRALSADINVKQEITKPDLIDSRYDRTAYQLGPKIIDGSINFPVVYEVNSGNTKTLFEIMYRLAVTRKGDGLLSDFELDVKYATTPNDLNTSGFTYKNCIINSFNFSVAQSDIVQCTVELIGRERVEKGFIASDDPANLVCNSGADGGFGTTRIVTWNDARVELYTGSLSGDAVIGGQYIRTFDLTIANDAERYYTLNGALFPQAIAPRKRDITGTIVLMGRHNQLGAAAFENQKHCNTDAEINFGYVTPNTGLECSSTTFDTVLPNVIYEIETMALTNDIFESTVAYHSLPAAGINVCDPLLQKIGDATFTQNYEQDN